MFWADCRLHGSYPETGFGGETTRHVLEPIFWGAWQIYLSFIGERNRRSKLFESGDAEYRMESLAVDDG